MKRNNLCKIKLVVLAMLVGLMVVVTGCKHEPDPEPGTGNVNRFSGTSWSIGADGTMEFGSNTFTIRNTDGWFNSDQDWGKVDYNGTYTYRGNVATMTFTHRKKNSDQNFTAMSPLGTATATLNADNTISIRSVIGNAQQGTITIEVIEE